MALSTVHKGPTVEQTSIFAVGGEVGGTKPDSVTLGGGSVFVEFGNGADSTGLSGSSTIVQYGPIGGIEHKYSLPGSVDGLKYNAATGKLWALDNQDGNSRLYLIDPRTHQVSKPLSYDSGYVYGTNSARGYDDVAFVGNRVYLSYTNPAQTGDAVVQRLDNGLNPTGTLHTTAILRMGDTGTNLATGQVNQMLPVSDPDSLKSLADGSLILTSGSDASYTIISHPGTAQQTNSFITVAGSTAQDDAVVPTSRSGTFVIANTNANDVLKVNVTGLNTHDLYASDITTNAIVQIDPATGVVTPIITGLSAPHGLAFIPSGGTSAAPALSGADQLLGAIAKLEQAIGHGGNAALLNGVVASLLKGAGQDLAAAPAGGSASLLALHQEQPGTVLTTAHHG